ncbi:MAG: hypothetical protein HQL72_08265 [Magnetococcales bacterium]|nr:hypothetical protein [Magnetococcales bacterium]
MRIFLYLLLGVMLLLAIVYGVRSLWREHHPSASNSGDGAANDSEYGVDSDRTFSDELAEWVKSPQGRMAIIALSGLFLLIALDRAISVGDQIPSDYIPAPSQDINRPVQTGQ